MQIFEVTKNKKNEPLNEGVWDTVDSVSQGVKQTASGIKNAVTNPGSTLRAVTGGSSVGGSVANRVRDVETNKAIKKFGDRAYDTWMNYVSQKMKTLPTPKDKKVYFGSTGYKDDLIAFLEKNFYHGQNLPPESTILVDKLAKIANQKFNPPSQVAEAPDWGKEWQNVKQDVRNVGKKLSPYAQTAQQLAQKGVDAAKQKGVDVASGVKSAYNNPYSAAKAGAKAVGNVAAKAGRGAAQGAKSLTTQTNAQERKYFQELIRLALVNSQQSAGGMKDKYAGAPVRIMSKPNEPPEALYLGRRWILNDEGRWMDENEKLADVATSNKLTTKLDDVEGTRQHYNPQGSDQNDPNMVVNSTGNRTADLVLARNGFNVR